MVIEVGVIDVSNIYCGFHKIIIVMVKLIQRSYLMHLSKEFTIASTRLAKLNKLELDFDLNPDLLSLPS